MFNILGKTSSEALTVLKSVLPFGFYRRNSVSHQVGNLAALVATSKKVVVFGGEHHKIEDPSPLTLFVLGIFLLRVPRYEEIIDQLQNLIFFQLSLPNY